MFLFSLNKLSALRLFSLLTVVILLCTSASCKARWGETTYAENQAVMVSISADFQMRLAGLTDMNKEVAMALLTVDLQDGFAGDFVVIRVNEREVFRREGVKTRFQTGYADSFEVNVQEGSATVEVALPKKNVSKSITVQVSNPIYLGVSITPEGKISYRVSQEPFGYL
ncbi:MAG: hypothetical protein LDL41_07875 [Coleofasciculus sp. S288]|nr:hypothetical protein [Coleofasciculus sp. S288]